MAQHRSKEEWTELLIAYENREGTQIEFCEENGISPASLWYHLRKPASQAKATKLVEIQPSKRGQNSSELNLLELNCQHSQIGTIMIRTSVNSLAEVIDQLNQK